MQKILVAIIVLLLSACAKQNADYPNAAGGELPTHYVVYKDSSFTPNSLSMVAGNNITFLNQTGAAIKLMTTDSSTIPLTIIEANKSYFFKKDTVGFFYYYNPHKPTAQGSFQLLP